MIRRKKAPPDSQQSAEEDDNKENEMKSAEIAPSSPCLAPLDSGCAALSGKSLVKNSDSASIYAKPICTNDNCRLRESTWHLACANKWLSTIVDQYNKAHPDHPVKRSVVEAYFRTDNLPADYLAYCQCACGSGHIKRLELDFTGAMARSKSVERRGDGHKTPSRRLHDHSTESEGNNEHNNVRSHLVTPLKVNQSANHFVTPAPASSSISGQQQRRRGSSTSSTNRQANRHRRQRKKSYTQTTTSADNSRSHSVQAHGMRQPQSKRGQQGRDRKRADSISQHQLCSPHNSSGIINSSHDFVTVLLNLLRANRDAFPIKVKDKRIQDLKNRCSAELQKQMDVKRGLTQWLAHVVTRHDTFTMKRDADHDFVIQLTDTGSRLSLGSPDVRASQLINDHQLSTEDRVPGLRPSRTAPKLSGASKVYSGCVENVFEKFGYLTSSELDTNVFFVPSHVVWDGCDDQQPDPTAYCPPLTSVFHVGQPVRFTAEAQAPRCGCRWLAVKVWLASPLDQHQPSTPTRMQPNWCLLQQSPTDSRPQTPHAFNTTDSVKHQAASPLNRSTPPPPDAWSPQPQSQQPDATLPVAASPEVPPPPQPEPAVNQMPLPASPTPAPVLPSVPTTITQSEQPSRAATPSAVAAIPLPDDIDAMNWSPYSLFGENNLALLDELYAWQVWCWRIYCHRQQQAYYAQLMSAGLWSPSGTQPMAQPHAQAASAAMADHNWPRLPNTNGQSTKTNDLL